MHETGHLPMPVVVGMIAGLAALIPPARAQRWVRPAGLLDVATLAEMNREAESLDWARKVVEGLDAGIQPWLAQPLDRIEDLMPRQKTQVYWLMTWPECRGGTAARRQMCRSLRLRWRSAAPND